MTRSITQQIEQIIEGEGMGYDALGPCSSLAVSYDRTVRAWRIYDDYADTHVRSLEEARAEIQRWRQALDDDQQTSASVCGDCGEPLGPQWTARDDGILVHSTCGPARQTKLTDGQIAARLDDIFAAASGGADNNPSAAAKITEYRRLG